MSEARGGAMGERRGSGDRPDDGFDEVVRGIERRVDPGSTALAVSVAMLVLVLGLVLPWTATATATATAQGWEVLAGTADAGFLPRLFAFTSLGFGLVTSAFALATRSWALSWVSAVGCGFSVVDGVWAIWSRQTAAAGGGPGIGLVVAVLAVLVLAVSWVRISVRR